MLWAILAVLSGLGDAVIFSLMKKLKQVNSSIVVWVQFSFALPLLLAFLYFYYPAKIDPAVYWAGILNALLYLGSTFILLKALQSSEMSISLPMLSLTPLFLVVISYFTLHELPSSVGFVGIVMIAIGAYVINLNRQKGFLEPFKSLFKVKGSFYVMIVAFIWAFTSILFKKGILASNAVYYNVLVYSLISVVMIPLLLFNVKSKMNEVKTNLKMLLALGITSGAMNIAAGYAMTKAIVPYVISLKRSSLIFSIFIGYFFFDEKNILKSLIGTFIMIIGGALIVLF